MNKIEKETAKKYIKDDNGDIWEYPEPRIVFTSIEFERKKNEIKDKIKEVQSLVDAIPNKKVPDEETLAFWQEYHLNEKQRLQEEVDYLQSQLMELEDADKL